MDMFNKLYSQVSSSVSSTVSQLSGVLPGNPVTREFDAAAHIASAGPGLLWKIYKGMKKSTKQEASIFVFEKRQLEKWNKTDRELILEALKRGVTQLTKIRHPQVLTVQHPLEESRESLAFATEPVFASLANIMGDTVNMPQPSNLSNYKFFDIEIKYGLLQIGEGLAFLHNDVKLLHRNISPETIIINQQGAWKIFGFDFCVHNTSPANITAFYPLEEFCPSLPSVAQPNLEYTAPECIITQSQSVYSDIFSLGMLSYALYSPGHCSVGKVTDIQQFRSRAQQLKSLATNKLSCIPEALREYVKMMLNNTAELRPDAHQFIKIPYFEDVGVKTLNYLDSLLQWDNLQKSQFYKGLPEALSNLPQRVRLYRVLPCLTRDLQQATMVPFVLPSILDISQECSQKEFVKHVLPYLKPIMKLMDPVQILLIFLQRMELLLKLTPAEDVQQHVLPMLYRGLDSDTPQIHDLCLSVLPTFAGLLDHANVKNSLLPRIKKLCLSTGNLTVRVNCLLCVGRLLEHLDKWLVLDEILPFLPQIPSREPAVLMGILGIYKLALNHKKLGISKEVLATRILPFLMPLCIENGLTLAQFNALVALVKQMFQIVENEHRGKLEQLNSVQQEKKALESTMPTITPGVKDISNEFSGFGLDKFVAPNSLNLNDKKSLLNQQEAIKVLQNAQPLKPITINKTSAEIKDFTSSFIPPISSPSNTNLMSPVTNNYIPQISSPPGFGSNLKSPVNNYIPQIPSPINSNLKSPLNSSIPQISSNLGNNSKYNSLSNHQNSQPVSVGNNQWNGWQNQWGGSMQTNVGNNDKQNWSALDSLLPSGSNQKLPMNQMAVNKPLLLSNKHNSTNNALSKDDIMDLLS